MLIDYSNGRLDEIRKFAEETNQVEAFNKKLDQLQLWENWYTDSGYCVTRIYSDFAPLSLYFTRIVTPPNGEEKCVGNGGLIYHGKHDGFGSGEGPTFSCCLTPTSGWSIHT